MFYFYLYIYIMKPPHQRLNVEDFYDENICQRLHVKLLEVPGITGDCSNNGGFSSSLLFILEDKVGEINKSYLGQIIHFYGTNIKKISFSSKFSFAFRESFKTR